MELLRIKLNREATGTTDRGLSRESGWAVVEGKRGADDQAEKCIALMLWEISTEHTSMN